MTTSENFEINELLPTRERLLVYAWMLPNEGKLTDSQRHQAMSNLKNYLRLWGLTSTDVARQIGKPKATAIGELLKEKYREGSDDHIRKLNNWLEQHGRQRSVKLGDKFVDTKIATDMLAIARLVRENSTMGICYGPTGIGKTRCSLAISDKYSGSIYLRIKRGDQHAKGLIHAIAGFLGLRATGSSKQDKHMRTELERVIDTLHESDRLLILDEAHKLRDEAIEVLRDIHDSTNIPILLVATRDLHDRIEKNADPDHGQLYSRIDISFPLTQGYDVCDGGRRLFTVENIKKLYNEDDSLKLTTDAAEYLMHIANDLGRGSLRKCKNVLRNALRYSRKRQDKKTDQRVTVCANDIEYVELRLRRESYEQQRVKDRAPKRKSA